MNLRHRPEIRGTFGVVSSTHWLATAIGMAMLERGGNAFDAAVATGLALNVVEPDQNGPGGEVNMMIYDTRRREVQVLCGLGNAPAAASVDRFDALGFDRVPATGHLPAIVPGAFGAWMLLLAEYGTVTVREAIAPARDLAQGGYPFKADAAGVVESMMPFFSRYWPSSTAIFSPGGQSPQANDLFCNPDLARTYDRLIREAESAGGGRERQIERAHNAWYSGFVAEAIERFLRQPIMDTSGRENAGFITGDDLARWKPTLERPVTYDYHGYRVCKPGPWTQGPIFLQQLAILSGFDLASLSPTGPEYVHLVAESAKLALADREAFYGDPAFAEIPIATLLSEPYNDKRRRLIGEEASGVLRPGSIEGYRNAVQSWAWGSTPSQFPEMTSFSSIELGDVVNYPKRRENDTCHFNIVDREGNMVSGTVSGGWLSGSPVVPDLGFCVTTRGQMFSLDRQHPNCLQPGKRPRITLTPTLALRDDEPYLAFGTPGGDCQDQWGLQAFLQVVHRDADLQSAVDAPSFFTMHAPGSFYPREARPLHLAVEEEFGDATLADLDRRGYELEVYGTGTMGNFMTMASRRGKTLCAGASYRRAQCYAAGR